MFVLESMKRYYRYLAFALPAVLYAGTIWQRPLFFPAEINAAELLRQTAVAGGTGAALLGAWSVKLFGANLFAVRLPDALAVLLTALLIRAVASGCGNRKIGDAAALIYLTTFFVFAFGTAAGTGAFFTLFCFGAVSGLIRALSDGKRPVRIAGGAGAAVSAALAAWYGMSGGAVPGFVLWKTLLFLLAGMLPWLFFDSKTITLSGKPPATSEGVYEIKITARNRKKMSAYIFVTVQVMRGYKTILDIQGAEPNSRVTVIQRCDGSGTCKDYQNVRQIDMFPERVTVSPLPMPKKEKNKK